MYWVSRLDISRRSTRKSAATEPALTDRCVFLAFTRNQQAHFGLGAYVWVIGSNRSFLRSHGRSSHFFHIRDLEWGPNTSIWSRQFSSIGQSWAEAVASGGSYYSLRLSLSSKNKTYPNGLDLLSLHPNRKNESLMPFPRLRAGRTCVITRIAQADNGRKDTQDHYFSFQI